MVPCTITGGPRLARMPLGRTKAGQGTCLTAPVLYLLLLARAQRAGCQLLVQACFASWELAFRKGNSDLLRNALAFQQKPPWVFSLRSKLWLNTFSLLQGTRPGVRAGSTGVPQLSPCRQKDPQPCPCPSTHLDLGTCTSSQCCSHYSSEHK